MITRDKCPLVRFLEGRCHVLRNADVYIRLGEWIIWRHDARFAGNKSNLLRDVSLTLRLATLQLPHAPMRVQPQLSVRTSQTKNWNPGSACVIFGR